MFVAYAFSGAAAGAAVTAREHENAEEALQRRLKESARVEERVTQIYTAQDFDRELQEVCVSLTFHDVVPSLAAAIAYLHVSKGTLACVALATQQRQSCMQAGDQLIVLEVESTEVCQTGFDEVEHHWKEDKEEALIPCRKLKHVLQRTARDSPDVRFVTLEVPVNEQHTDGQAHPLLLARA